MRRLVLPVFCAIVCSLGITGCSLTSSAPPSPAKGNAIQGTVRGGQQPIVGAHVYLLAAGTGGYGEASTSMLTSGSGSDTIGEYVATDSGGAFTITGDYTCTAGAQVYLYSLGGNAGSGANSAAGLLAALGQCPVSGTFAVSTPYVVIDEVTTVAAAYSVAAFATDATHVGSSGTTQAQAGIANAFVNAATLANIVTGTAPTNTPSGNGTVPQAELNTIANILAACVNSTGPASAACATLFADARSGGSTGTVPTDTATAAINMAHNPAANVVALYALQLASTPFQPNLTVHPADFTVTLLIPSTIAQIAVDASGRVWGVGGTTVAGVPNDYLLEYASNGALLSPTTGYIGGGVGANSIGYGPVAIDPSGNIWTLGANPTTNAQELIAFSSAGTPLTGSPFTGNGLSYQRAISIDGSGNIWTANGASISKFSGSGLPFLGSPFSGNGIISTSAASSLAIDSGGNVWVYGNTLSKFTNAGAAAAGSPFSIASHSQTPIAIDASNNVWLESSGYNSLIKLTNAGVAYSGSPFNGGGTANGSYGLAIDGSGNVWADSQSTGFGPGTLVELANSGTAISPSPNGYFPQGLTESNDPIVVDPSGSVWVAGTITGANAPALSITIGAASPVVTPLSVAVKNNTIGTRP